ncbi:MAG: fibrillarin-like rRNA/tRNA 2'-O-methyltransferase, partial [Candidatus Woesearchaeota archaeon]
MITKSKIFEVYEEKRKRNTILHTKNLTPGKSLYGERLVREGSDEYREWDPNRSKLASIIMKGCQNIFLRREDVVLYLGAASGTTASHVSDIVSEGFVFSLDFAPRVVRNLYFLCLERENMAPILADAHFPESYKDRITNIDFIYQDIAQKDQVEIFLKNCRMFLKDKGFAMLAVKARSMDVTKKPKQIFLEVQAKLEKALTIVDSKELAPYQMDHMMFVCKK